MKKGFTLIEVIATLAVLAIILVIAVPKIIDIYGNSKESTLQFSANLVANSIKTEYHFRKQMQGGSFALNGTCPLDIVKWSVNDGTCTYEINNLNEIAVITVTIVGSGKYEGLTVIAHSPNLKFINQVASLDIEYLVIGGGGSGGHAGGGGGAGGFLTGFINVEPGTHEVVVGSGGNGTSTRDATGNPGQPSSFADIIASGGGAGGGYNKIGTAGDSGGGGGGQNGSEGGMGIENQGNIGGYSITGSGTGNAAGGGGGGASTPGQTGYFNGDPSLESSYVGGNGGDGLSSSISGELKYYAGGGGGRLGSLGTSSQAGLGGQGGGGNSGTGLFGSGQTGQANTGSGGGGGGWSFFGSSGAGGSGVVIIRYLGPQVAEGGIVTIDNEYIIHTFNNSGSFEFGIGE